ncbi:MAG TPA: 2-oxo-4-hydroxy-4-carboxy-5-ureidoimidazoline decarboxylase [Thermoanaerobaculia bacterium]|nr:2-oxo-4-hydroxy-4-carboxy-5-ureidoimidazoline decarboxylase [Thermoanaerobaculia bacterium]
MTRAASSGLERLNELPPGEAETLLLSCCGSREWARRLSAERPFGRAEELAEASDRIWRSLPKEEWLGAFAAHPRLGEVAGTGPTDLHPQQSIAGTGPAGLHPPPSLSRAADWSRREQAGTKSASRQTLANLAEANREYEERFGHIFIVCASGKSAAEMLALVQSRLHNDAQTELEIAAEEQRKITRLRLAKLLEAEGA